MPSDALARTGRSPKQPVSVVALASSCEVGDVEGAAQLVVDRALARGGGYVCLCNVHLVTLALQREDVRAALAAAWKRLPDGAPVAWMQRRIGFRHAARIAGPDLMPRVVDLGRAHDLRHFLFGSTVDISERVRLALETGYPGAKIVGQYSPAFSEDAPAFADATEVIRSSHPDIVWCALGAPKQELWMHRFAPDVDAVFLGVGAAFDFLAMSKRRAPTWMQRTGFEWLHRLSSEPQRLGGRYLRTNSEFLARSIHELTRRRLQR